MSHPIETVATERVLRAEINLYYDLHLAPSRHASLLIALHGYGANKQQMMREARQMAPEDFAVASLQGFYQHLREAKEEGGPLRFGFGWLTNFRPEQSINLHHRALLQMIESLIAEESVDPHRIFLLGFSQSCALNYRFAFTHPDRLRGIIGICGGLPGDWETSELYKPTSAAIFHLSGTLDQFYPSARVSDYAERLRLRAHDVEVKAYDAGHEIAPPMHTDVRLWLAEHAGQ